VRQDSDVLIALSDPPATSMVPNPVWSEIHSLVIAPACSTCHSGGGFGGLSGLDDCDTGYASLVNVASVQLPSMDRVTPTDPTNSWFMHKLDGTQGTFTAMCTGMFCGQQMPFGGPYLSMEVRDAIRTWIMNGALNDCP
jgi:hypothetical protein